MKDKLINSSSAIQLYKYSSSFREFPKLFIWVHFLRWNWAQPEWTLEVPHLDELDTRKNCPVGEWGKSWGLHLQKSDNIPYLHLQKELG